MISLTLFVVALVAAIYGFIKVHNTGGTYESFAGGCYVYGSLAVIGTVIGWIIAFMTGS